MEPVLPLHRLGRSARCVAFTHPRPVYDPHILIVPTTPIPSITYATIGSETRVALLWEMIELGRKTLSAPATDWQMIVNGGRRQDIGQVHGHLIHAREIPLSDHQFELSDPSTTIAPWAHLLAAIDAAAQRPDNGYSVVFEFSDHGAISAWISESIPA